jgi:hypothetical protein
VRESGRFEEKPGAGLREDHQANVADWNEMHRIHAARASAIVTGDGVTVGSPASRRGRGGPGRFEPRSLGDHHRGPGNRYRRDPCLTGSQ